MWAALAAALCLATPLVAQQSGADAQLHTGIASGVENEARLKLLFDDHQYPLLATELDKLPAEQALLYRGLLANRDNDLKRSIALLEPLVEAIASSGDRQKEKLVRKALAEDYLRSGDWARAAQAYATLDKRLGDKLTDDERDEIEMPLKLLPLLRNAPPTVVEPCEPFELQVERDPLGLIDAPVFVEARPRRWMLDPPAPFNLIAHSTAKEVGLKLSAESAAIRTLTGRPIVVHATVIPRFTIGGRITLRNMPAFVFEDADYSFPHVKYQVQGVLGYPALAAMGSLTVTQNATIELRPALQPRPDNAEEILTRGARFFLDGDRIIVALGKTARTKNQLEDPGAERMYVIDAGGQQSYLTARYYDEHASDFAGMQMQLYAPSKLDNVAPTPAYLADSVPLYIGERTVNAHFVQVLTQPLGESAIDDVYGVLGMDILDQFESYTFDYRTMRFTARSR